MSEQIAQGGGDENDQRNGGPRQPHSAAAGAGLMSQLEADKCAEHGDPLYVEAQTNFVVEVRLSCCIGAHRLPPSPA